LSRASFSHKIENMNRKILFIFILGNFFLFLFKITPLVFASSEFETDYNVNYEVSLSGKITVTQEISLTNKLSNIYATQYTLTIKGEEIENIQASDKTGPLKTEIKKTNKETKITLGFDRQVVGLGKTLNFTLKYETPNLAKKNGQIWEINIPKTEMREEINNYTLTLIVPKKFGEPLYIKPEPVEKRGEKDYNIFRFTKEQAISRAIVATFGKFQIFDFEISYYLENPNSELTEFKIAIPPDTSYQKINYYKIEPLPINIFIDNDGNWLAKYLLNPKQKMTIKAAGKVKIFHQPQKNFPPPTSQNLKNNLLPKKYWEADHPLISQKANELKTPEAIYNFVTNTLTYDFNRVEKNPKRMGALQALNYPQSAICMEFTDLFIALARAAGIPAREINGFAYTTNEKLTLINLNNDVLHSWPEYYDGEKRVWVPVDPTWEKTTGGIDYFKTTDLNHFAFVIHGEDSESPPPAGSYKNKETQGKNINVVFGEDEEEKAPNVKVEFSLPERIYWRLKSEGKIILKNNGPSAAYNLTTIINPYGLTLKTTKQLPLKIEILPPFAIEEIGVELKTNKLRYSPNPKLEVSLNEQLFTYSFKEVSFKNKLVLAFLLIFFVFFIIFFLTKKVFYDKKE